MAGPLQVDLDDEERRVLQVLTEAGRPLEVVEAGERGPVER